MSTIGLIASDTKACRTCVSVMGASATLLRKMACMTSCCGRNLLSPNAASRRLDTDQPVTLFHKSGHLTVLDQVDTMTVGAPRVAPCSNVVPRYPGPVLPGAPWIGKRAFGEIIEIGGDPADFPRASGYPRRSRSRASYCRASSSSSARPNARFSHALRHHHVKVRSWDRPQSRIDFS